MNIITPTKEYLDEHIDVLTDMYLEVFTSGCYSEDSYSKEDVILNFYNSLAKDEIFLIAEMNNKPVGFITGKPSIKTAFNIHKELFDNNINGIYWIVSIATKPTLQGQGIGNRLLAAFEKEVNKDDELYSKIGLRTSGYNNPAIKFYLNNNYKQISGNLSITLGNGAKVNRSYMMKEL